MHPLQETCRMMDRHYLPRPLKLKIPESTVPTSSLGFPCLHKVFAVFVKSQVTAV